MADPGGLHTSSPEELRSRLAAERAGRPFLEYRDGEGEQQIVVLRDDVDHLTVGRRPSSDVPLAHDGEVSRLHAELRCVGDDWTLSDDGLSRNGSFVNGQRIIGRTRLSDGDALRFGNTVVIYREPASRASVPTLVAIGAQQPVPVSETKRRVLVALCRPLAESSLAPPATNKQIADEVFLSVQAVKAHLRELFGVFGLQDEGQYHKRANLAWAALSSGTITTAELSDRVPSPGP
jgi:pSer/pThr/pTyr-binding forkhead associated (FHA) protein